MDTPTRSRGAALLPTPASKSQPRPQTQIITTSQNIRGLGLPTHPVRHRRFLINNLTSAITKPTMRRLARRGGVRRIQSLIYEETRKVVKDRLKQILHHAIAICDHSNRKTLTTLDVVYALRVLGSPIYGFGTVIKGDNIKSRAEYMRNRKRDNQKKVAEYEHRREQERAKEAERERKRRQLDNIMARAMRR